MFSTTLPPLLSGQRGVLAPRPSTPRRRGCRCARGPHTTGCRPRTRTTSSQADSCEFANDGTCDEPDLCARGTDTTDCRPRTRTWTTSGRADSCEFANDGTCDEPDLCARGTDVAPFRASGPEGRRRQTIAVDFRETNRNDATWTRAYERVHVFRASTSTAATAQ